MIVFGSSAAAPAQCKYEAVTVYRTSTWTPVGCGAWTNTSVSAPVTIQGQNSVGVWQRPCTGVLRVTDKVVRECFGSAWDLFWAHGGTNKRVTTQRGPGDNTVETRTETQVCFSNSTPPPNILVGPQRDLDVVDAEDLSTNGLLVAASRIGGTRYAILNGPSTDGFGTALAELSRGVRVNADILASLSATVAGLDDPYGQKESLSAHLSGAIAALRAMAAELDTRMPTDAAPFQATSDELRRLAVWIHGRERGYEYSHGALELLSAADTLADAAALVTTGFTSGPPLAAVNRRGLLIQNLLELVPAWGRLADRSTGVEIDAGGLSRLTAKPLYPVERFPFSKLSGHAMYGVARDRSGNLFVTGSRSLIRREHQLFVFDASGAYQGGVPQPPSAQASTWGVRDLAYDPVRDLVYGAASNARILAFNPLSRRWDDSRGVAIDELPLASIQALAFNAFGDGGHGSFWLSGPTGDVFEISRRSGRVMRRHPSIQASTTGAAFDLGTGAIWWIGDDDGIVATEMDAATGAVTGTRFEVPGISSAFGGGAELTVVQRDDVWQPQLTILGQGRQDVIVDVDPVVTFQGSSGGRIRIAGRLSPGGHITLALDECPARGLALAHLAFSEGSISPVAFPGLFAPGSVLALGQPMIVIPIGLVTEGHADFTFDIPDRSLQDLVAHWQWAVFDFETTKVWLSDAGANVFN
jgi:hypothetical protein